MTGAVLWADACEAAALFAVDPAGLGGIAVRSRAGPVRDTWRDELLRLLPPGAPIRRVPLHVADQRLLGGLDLAATLRAGRPVAERGLLAEADGGVVLLAMAERLSAASAAHLTAALDAGEVVLERDGLGRRFDCRAGMVLFDEGDADDERPPAALLDRCAFLLDLATVSNQDCQPSVVPDVSAARAGLARVEITGDQIEVLAATAMGLGIDSVRAVLSSVKAARAAAALEGRAMVSDADIVTAARLVLAPRATAIPTDPEAPLPEPPEAEQPDPGDAANDDPADADQGSLEEMVVEAAKAAIPAGLLAALQSQAGQPARSTSAPGRAGAAKTSQRRGRPIGVRAGDPVAGARLNVVATLCAAAPWQPVRRRAAPDHPARILIRREDFRITRFEQRTHSTAIFVVDASGSAALNRLAEAKGAVELLLADCYVRRDQVALLAFRGPAATLLLPPTGSLVRAKRSLAGLAGGGGTPLASAIRDAGALADLVRRRGQTPFIVMLTDGRGNIALDGSPGRTQAMADAAAASKTIRAAGYAALLIDTSPNPQAQGRTLAAEMGAKYLPLPYADSAALSQAVRKAT